MSGGHGNGTPLIAACTASHDRPLRLRWLLNALEEQTLSPGEFEVVVAHDSSQPETGRLLREHPLAAAGVLRHVTLPPGSAPPGANRNAAWRLARAPLIAFSDDDCRPPPDWLERYLEAARRHPGAIIQGSTVTDPVEEPLRHGLYRPVPWVEPPDPRAQACNILYPRELLERLGGFDETLYTGEDTDLGARARRSGAPFVAASEIVNYHSVQPTFAHRVVLEASRWKDLPEVIRRHPGLRDSFPLWIFFNHRHAWLPLAAAGAVLQRRNPLYALLAYPYLMHAFPSHGLNSPRGRLRSLLELPRGIAVELAEMAALARGSAKARTLFL